jgi:hypothetical protein
MALCGPLVWNIPPPSAPPHPSLKFRPFSYIPDYPRIPCQVSMPIPGAAILYASAPWFEHNHAQDHTKIRQENMDLAKENAALKLLLCRHGVSAKESHGLVPRAGRKPTRTEPVKARRDSNAEAALRMCKMLQGDNLPDVIEALVDRAINEDPLVRDRLMKTGGIPTTFSLKPDKRHKTGVRKVMDKIMPNRNAALWQMKTGATASTIKTLRKMGGRAIIDTPQQLMAWTLRQPELPEFEFVIPGGSAVWAPALALFAKLEKSAIVQDMIRWAAPYTMSKLKQLFVWYMVSAVLVVTNAFVSCRVHCVLIDRTVINAMPRVSFHFYFI